MSASVHGDLLHRMIPEKISADREHNQPYQLQSEKLQKTLPGVGSALAEKDGERYVVYCAERQILDHEPRLLREERERDRRAGQEKYDRLLDDVDAPGRFGKQTYGCYEHFDVVVDYQCQHHRDRCIF